jgi:hypothetical protein
MIKKIVFITLLSVFIVPFIVISLNAQEANMILISSDFGHNEMIPPSFTCQGDDINPSLEIKDIPDGTRSLTLIMDDPDAPVGTWDHWIVFNIPPDTTVINQNSVPGTQGKNSWGRQNYGGPCPPSGTHRYIFKLYALDTTLDLPEDAAKSTVEQAMRGHILDEAQLIGLYNKS